MSRKDEFKTEIKAVVKDIEKNYKEMLACLKFQNKTYLARDQRSKHIRLRSFEEDINSGQNEDSEYIFYHELSKESRLQIFATRLMDRLADLGRLNSELRNQVLISTQAEPPISRVKEVAAEMQSVIRKRV